MTKYIEQEAAVAVIEEKQKELCPVGMYSRHAVYGSDREKFDAWEEIIEALEAIPAADVAPVRHGRWVKARGSWCTPGGDPVWECSECGKGRHVYGIEHGTYGADVADGQWVSCPNCGATMAEGKA